MYVLKSGNITCSGEVLRGDWTPDWTPCEDNIVFKKKANNLKVSKSGSKWLQMAPTGSKWLQETPNGYKWLKMAQKVLNHKNKSQRSKTGQKKNKNKKNAKNG